MRPPPSRARLTVADTDVYASAEAVVLALMVQFRVIRVDES
jgi:hypothetical protein